MQSEGERGSWERASSQMNREKETRELTHQSNSSPVQSPPPSPLSALRKKAKQHEKADTYKLICILHHFKVNLISCTKTKQNIVLQHNYVFNFREVYISQPETNGKIEELNRVINDCLR